MKQNQRGTDVKIKTKQNTLGIPNSVKNKRTENTK
jgi:hypothetical protein